MAPWHACSVAGPLIGATLHVVVIASRCDFGAIKPTPNHKTFGWTNIDQSMALSQGLSGAKRVPS